MLLNLWSLDTDVSLNCLFLVTINEINNEIENVHLEIFVAI